MDSLAMKKQILIDKFDTWTITKENPKDTVPCVVSCRSTIDLPCQLTRLIGEQGSDSGWPSSLSMLTNVDFNFSDGETCVRLDHDLNGRDAFLFQSLYDPNSSRHVDQNYLAFLIAVRACKEWGAKSVIGLIPYLTYLRQNKSSKDRREPVTAKLMADLANEAGLDGLITFHPHIDRLDDFYQKTWLELIDPVDLFVPAFVNLAGQKDVIVVAPDAGARAYAEEVARRLDLDFAATSKHRPEAEKVEIREIEGDFQGKRAVLLLDDMLSSGGTIIELIKKLTCEKGIQEVYLGISHNLGQETARTRLLDLYAHGYLKRVILTNSIPQREAFLSLPFLSCIDLAEPFAAAAFNGWSRHYRN
jgi:ribose-phosphate pyrophosphokinase